MTPPKQAAARANAVSWRDVDPAPVVLVSGPEEYLAIRAMDTVRAKLRVSHPDLEVTKLDAGSYTAGQLAMTASPSLFGEGKLIEVSGLAAMNDDFLTDGLAYLNDVAEDVVLVLHHGGGVRGKKLLDAVKAAGAPVVDCQPLKKDADKAAFVSGEFRAGGRRIEGAAVQALVAAVGANLSELAAACRQLIEDSTTAVTTDTVEKYYGGRVEATAFRVADAAVGGQGPLALSMLRHALATGVDPVPLVAALAMKVRTVAKVAGARGSSAQIAKEFGMQPWQVDQARRDANRWTEEALVRCVRILAEADAQVKGEARDPVYAVERAVTAVALAARRG
ncbi:DNA polymerase III subunit delta [Paenarthrobacter sp. DKR-5]|uniref:DNA polymerase III subunit delta n=1 Tax=Paenarthrobacter sp. DKR-5 TaxID=2835535 RepID=UPI001BDC3615|nr:DNA polymerase III subunit delta [Paenarthrobacter sp. DKR-5]MBT1001705.1 DNA polymerase III subunit delta [Paenarthrobacter sp. DKR-5]